MRNFFRKNLLEISIFFLVFLILGFFASKTFLFYDDITWSFPSITKDYANFYQNYLKDWGLFRPLAWPYYILIYKIFSYTPYVVHLIPLAILTIASFLLYKSLFYQGLSRQNALSIGITFSVFPFAIESVCWLAANTSMIVVLIFFLQLYLIESNIFKKYLVKMVLFLQFISIFLYESMLFMPFALGYLLYSRKIIKNKLQLILFSITPLITYISSKIIIKPILEHRDKLINISEIGSYWISTLQHLVLLFSPYYLKNFWTKELVSGYNLIVSNALIILLFLIFIILLMIIFFQKQDRQNQIIKPSFKINLNFWILSFFVSLIPLSWHPEYLPFRLLFFPLIIFIITLSLFFIPTITKAKLVDPLNYCLKFGFITIIIVFLMIQVSMINHYAIQYLIDKKMVLEIDQKLEDSGFEHPYRSNLLLKNFKNNNLNILVYGDYINGLMSRYFTASALLDLNSGSFAKVAIEIPDNNIFSAEISKKDFLKLRPLTIMRFTDNQSCLTGECLKVEAVYQKPY